MSWRPTSKIVSGIDSAEGEGLMDALGDTDALGLTLGLPEDDGLEEALGL